MTTTARMLSDEERRVMKHALGWPKFYRNYYAADDLMPQLEIWRGLERLGLARELDAGGVPVSGLTVFAVTKAGMGELIAAEVAP